MRVVNVVMKLVVIAYVINLGALGYATIISEKPFRVGSVSVPALPFLHFLGVAAGLGLVIGIHATTQRATCASCHAYAGRVASRDHTGTSYAHERVGGGRDRRYKSNVATEHYKAHLRCTKCGHGWARHE